jgi:nucleoside-triphosphatase THEP1
LPNTPRPMTAEAPSKAQDLRQALNLFDPEEPLHTREELEHFSVDRTHSPIDDIQFLLEATDGPEKFLFSGHRGSGKSTELARLTQRLGDQFRVVEFSVMQELDLFELQYVDVLLGLALELAGLATEEDIDVKESVLEHVFQFARDVTEEVQVEEHDGAEVGASLNAFAASLSAKLRAEDVTRRTVRENVSRRITELLESIELLTKEIERVTGQDLLVVIDDIDKVDLSTAKSMFFEHASTLSEPPLSIIYTFPMPLRHDNSFQQVRNSFSNVKILPNIKTQERDGTPFEPGLETTEHIVTKRLETVLIEENALDELARLSSGVPRQLVILVRQACLDTLKEGRGVIDTAAVQAAANQQRREYEVLLDRSQRELLKEVHTNKAINNDEPHRALLHNLSVLQYRNDDVWYDVHPIVLPLIEVDEDSAESDA